MQYCVMYSRTLHVLGSSCDSLLDWLLLIATGCYRLLPAAIGCYWLLPAATGCCRLLPAATCCYLLLLAATGCHWLLPVATGCYRLLLAATGCLQRRTRSVKLLAFYRIFFLPRYHSAAPSGALFICSNRWLHVVKSRHEADK